MYKVDHTAAALFHRVLHIAGGLHMFDHASHHGQLLIPWLDVAPSLMGANTVTVL